MSEYTILLVDDEPDILEFLKYNLEKESFNVFTCENGKEAVALALEHKPHLIVLDVMMPEMDGMETCMEIRKNPLLKDTIVVFLTARNEDYSQIAGLEAGADDYIHKPIKPRLFISKINSLLRRTPLIQKPDNTLDSQKIVIHHERYTVEKDGVEIELPKKEFELLALLMSRPSKVFTRDEILEKVWGEDVFVGDRTIDVHVRKLREKLGDSCIRTLKGVGYKFEEEKP